MSVLQREMNRKGIYIDFLFTEEYDHAVMARADLIFMQRPFRDTDLRIAKLAKSNGVPIWIDYDDDLFSVPNSNPTYKIYGGDEVKKRVAQLCACADTISVTTPYFKKKLEGSPLPLCKDIRVIPNAYNDALLGTKRKLIEQRNALIFWRGSATHQEDIEEYMGPIVETMKENPKWTFLFQGDKYWRLFQQAGKNAVFADGIDPIEYFKMLSDTKPSATWVPLADSPFNRSKSNIAWLESVHAGCVTIGPKWEEWERPGCLNYSSKQTFYDAAAAIIKEEVDIEEQNRLAWEYVMDNLRLTTLNKLRMQIIEDLMTKRYEQKTQF